MLVLFAIPILCIIVVAFAQFGDEMFKKKFFIERRNRSANEQAQVRRRSNRQPPTANRRYNDPPAPVVHSEPTAERSVATDTPNLETSGIRN
jgi:hypothetical protein